MNDVARVAILTLVTYVLFGAYIVAPKLMELIAFLVLGGGLFAYVVIVGAHLWTED